MKIIFVRHGESEANAALVVGGPDSPLSEVGVEQARLTGMKLKDQGIAQIISSPYLRAQQTAEIIAGELGIPVDHIKVVEELHERRMGLLEDKPKRHSTEYFVHNDMEHGFESHYEVIERVKTALRKIEQIAGGSDGTTLVVGHATSGYFLQQVAKGKAQFDEFEAFEQLSNAGFMEIESVK